MENGYAKIYIGDSKEGKCPALYKLGEPVTTGCQIHVEVIVGNDD